MCRAGWRLQPLQKALIQKLGISWQQPAQSSLTASYGEVEPGIICESVIGNWPWRPAAAAGAWPPCLKASCSQVPGVSPRESWCLGSFVMNTAGCWSSHQLMKPASQLQCRDEINVTHCHTCHAAVTCHTQLNSHVTRVQQPCRILTLTWDLVTVLTMGHRVKQLLVVESLT